MKLKYSRAGLVVKPNREVGTFLRRTVRLLESFGVSVFLEKAAAELIGRSSAIPRSEISQYCDIIVLIGGDGTFLSVARQAVLRQIPIAGFNLGTFGFLTELKKEDLEQTLRDIIYGKAPTSCRNVLEARIGKERGIALNDVVINRGNVTRLITLGLEIDQSHVAEIRTDGIIVATPTGSTAYSLSAGGPILAPETHAFLVTPICAHTLTFRPLVVPASARVKITLLSEAHETSISIDGQRLIPLGKGETVEIKFHPHKLHMFVDPQMSFFKLIREKFRWG